MNTTTIPQPEQVVNSPELRIGRRVPRGWYSESKFAGEYQYKPVGKEALLIRRDGVLVARGGKRQIVLEAKRLNGEYECPVCGGCRGCYCDETPTGNALERAIENLARDVEKAEARVEELRRCVWEAATPVEDCLLGVSEISQAEYARLLKHQARCKEEHEHALRLLEKAKSRLAHLEEQR